MTEVDLKNDMDKPGSERVPVLNLEVGRSKDRRYGAPFSAFLSSIPAYIAITVIGSLVLSVIYDLRHTDLRIPLVNDWDGTFYDAIVKNLVEAGHFYINPLLGAPGVQNLYDFPLPHAVHLLGLAILGLFSHKFALVINLYYLFTFPLEAMTAFYVFRRFGISAGLGIAGGILFAFLPFHLLRSQGHLVLTSYYLVPLVVLVLLWICRGDRLFGFESNGENGFISKKGVAGLVICILIASDNPYWAFFSGIFVIVAGVVARFRYGRPRAQWTSAIIGGTIALVFCLNLLPNIAYTYRHGLNPVNHRLPVESEIYGLRITQLVLPVSGHRVPALARVKQHYDARSFNINENRSATLGLFGTLGFLLLLGCLFIEPCGLELQSLSVLNLAALLVGTMGGFGAVFSFVVWSQFRGYNRISVFIAFFSLFALLLVLERWLRVPSASHKWMAYFLLPAVLLGIGLPDEIPTRINFMPYRMQEETTFRQDQDFFARLEASVPPHSMIFQLPYYAFLGPPPPGSAMVGYDELKGYLYSKALRWSGGATINRETDGWIRAVSAKPMHQMVAAVGAAGFAGIYIDRFGYTDRGLFVESQLRELLGAAPLISTNGRRSFFRFSPELLEAVHDMAATEGKSYYDFLGVTAEAVTGCSRMEGTDARSSQWCGREATIEIYNPASETRSITIEAVFATGYSQRSRLVIQGPNFRRTLTINNVGTALRTTFMAGPGRSIMRLSSDSEALKVPEDPRDLVFRIVNLHCCK